jgi:TM2 domain-containing membrane protein YozV
VASLLGVVFGAIGLHRMYLGYWGIAIAQILVTYLTGGFGVVWGFVDGVLIFTGHVYKDSKGRLLK